MSKSEKKQKYFVKLKKYFGEYKSIFVVNVDNVGSNQMHQIRQSLRGEAEVLMGKNTMVRRAMKNFGSEMPVLEKLLPLVRGNIGFVFTNSDLKDIRAKLVANKVAAPAKAGVIAPCSVTIPAGNTGMEPGKTSFFQALGVPTKITKGTIEIVSDVHLIVTGQKVGPSEAALLTLLSITPFTYGMSVVAVYDDGTIFSSEILDIEESTLLDSFVSGARDVAAICLEIDYPTIASIPHSIVNGYKNLLAIALSTEFEFEGSKKLKEIMANPGAFAAAAPAAGGSAAAPAAAAAVEEESDEDVGFGLFD